MKAYKGFNKDMTCRGFQFEEGKIYTEDKAELCKSGFHACEKPFDCFKYYPPYKSVYHEVTLDNLSNAKSDDSKVCGKSIKIGASIGIPGLVKAQIEYTKQLANNMSAATSGNGSSAATSGEESSAATSNPNGIALANGKNSIAKGVIGSYLILTEWSDDKTILIGAKMERVDGEKIKADTWYKLEDGEFVEVKDDDLLAV